MLVFWWLCSHVKEKWFFIVPGQKGWYFTIYKWVCFCPLLVHGLKKGRFKKRILRVVSTSQYGLVRSQRLYTHQLPVMNSLHRKHIHWVEIHWESQSIPYKWLIYLLPVCPLEAPPVAQPIPRVWPLGCQTWSTDLNNTLLASLYMFQPFDLHHGSRLHHLCESYQHNTQAFRENDCTIGETQ